MNKQIKTLLPWLAPVIPGLLGLVFLLFTRLTFLALFLLATAGFLLCDRLLPLLERKHAFAASNLRKVLTALVTFTILVVSITGIFVAVNPGGAENTDNTYVLLLGCQVRETGPSPTLQERIHRAYTYLQEHPDTICIVTGGKGSDEIMSEAQCMKSELTAMGIDESRIWLEDQATSTQENLQYSMALIQEKTGTTPNAITIISSETHLFRAALMAKNLGLTATSIPAVTKPFLLRINNGLREIAAIWIYLITGG